MSPGKQRFPAQTQGDGSLFAYLEITRIHRKAISLLEVLIAIGVLAIGLLGVVALIPIASQQAEAGARKDAIAIAGRRAFDSSMYADSMRQLRGKFHMTAMGIRILT